jgi:serine/threonine protein phosphatase 1
MNKIFVVGDIHGCFDKLCALMDKIPINYAQDQLIFIGDYIDRGQSSVDVVDYLMDFKKRVPGTIFLKGNHEDMLQNYLDGSDRFTYMLNGGQRTLDEYLNRSNNAEAFPIPRTISLYMPVSAKRCPLSHKKRWTCFGSVMNLFTLILISANV